MTAQTAPPFKFPKRFLWGAAISAHQAEGGNHNQWSVWELQNAKVLAQQAKYRAEQGGTSGQEGVAAGANIQNQAANPANYVSGRAADHYNRYREDFALLKKLNMNTLRFSIEWSRVEPEPGAWNPAAIQHYRDYLQTLQAAGIEPIVTLWHWTVPVWFDQLGGFTKRGNLKYFERFVRKIFEELGREFRYVITLNEPEIYIINSYLLGEWPPQHKSKVESMRVYVNLLAAHKRAYKIAKASGRKYVVGLAKNCVYHYAGDDAKLSVTAARIATAGDNLFLDRAKRHLDFIGLNYYFSNRYYGYRVHNPNQRVSDMGWDMQPAHIQLVLERLHARYKLPIIVTENGCADASDQHRKWWLSQTLVAMQKALQNGVKLEGYLHWSLLDNFEWASGFWPRFGLVAVDYKTMERTVRPSAVWLAKMIKFYKN